MTSKNREIIGSEVWHSKRIRITSFLKTQKTDCHLIMETSFTSHASRPGGHFTINTWFFRGRVPKKMSLNEKIQKFFKKLTACYKQYVPDAYEGREKNTTDPYGTCEKKRPAGYVIGGKYGG